MPIDSHNKHDTIRDLANTIRTIIKYCEQHSIDFEELVIAAKERMI